MRDKSKRKGSILITIGLLLLVAALIISSYNIIDERRAGQSSYNLYTQLNSIIVAADNTDTSVDDQTDEMIPDYILNPDMDMPLENIDGWNFIGVLEIPSLGLSLPIISDWSYPAMKVAPCRYSGSAYKDDLILSGHNYRSHFGRLYDLTGGEEVIFTDTMGNVFKYIVVERETVYQTAVDVMMGGDWDLTLFTCTMNGTSRVTIRCDRIVE